MTGSARVSALLALCAALSAAAARKLSAEDVPPKPIRMVVILMQEIQNEIELTGEKLRTSASRHALVTLLSLCASSLRFVVGFFTGGERERERQRERETERERNRERERQRERESEPSTL